MKKLFLLLFIAYSHITFAQVELRADSTIVKSKLRIKNHNEGLGKVLTSDELGNANWQAIPALTNFWQIGSTSSEITPIASITKVKIPGTLQIPTGAANGRYLKSDATGNAAWATFPSFNLSLPYSGGISSNTLAFNIYNSNSLGYAFRTEGNIMLSNINEQEGRILFSTDKNGDAKWADGACISKCSFSITKVGKSGIATGVLQFLSFDKKLFDICNTTNPVNIGANYDIYTFTAPIDGIYQFDFVGPFLSSTDFTLGIYTVTTSNTPGTQLYVSSGRANAMEQSTSYTAILKLNAGDKIAPTAHARTSPLAFNNSSIEAGVRFSGHIIEATDCFSKK